MAKFKVKKHQDAYVVYQTVVEADDANQAIAIADSHKFDGRWVESHVAEFDDYDIFPEEIEEVDADFTLDDLEEVVRHEFSPAERDAVLASLRLWRKVPEDTRSFFNEIFTNNEHHAGLTNEEIDDLCERINV